MRLRNNRRKKQPKPSEIRPWSGVRNAVIAVLLAVNVVLLLALGMEWVVDRCLHSLLRWHSGEE